MGWLTILHIAPYSTKNVPQSQHMLTAVTGSPAITSSFGTVTDSEPGLSSKYGNVPLMMQYCEKLADANKNTAPLNFSLYALNSTELLHNLQHCSHTLMYTIHMVHVKKNDTDIRNGSKNQKASSENH